MKNYDYCKNYHINNDGTIGHMIVLSNQFS